MKHKIKYFYQTGDSFHTEDAKDVLEIEWDDLSVAKESLKRIKEHYKWYQSLEHSWEDELPEPNWFNVTEKDELMRKYLINLPLDNGKEYQFHAPWCGYFETLYGAEIISEDDDMKFEVGDY